MTLEARLTPQAIIHEWIHEMKLGKFVVNSRPGGGSRLTSWVIALKRCESDGDSHRVLYIQGDWVRIRVRSDDLQGSSVIDLRMTSPDFFDELFSWVWGEKSRNGAWYHAHIEEGLNI